MITKEQKKAIVKSIGKNYITKIFKFAEDNDRRKENGDVYSKSTFTMTLGGHLAHSEVEKIIFDASEFYLAESEKEDERRKSFIEKVKSKKK